MMCNIFRLQIFGIWNLKQNDILIYTSFEQEEVRAYLKDVLYFVKDQCLLAPSYEILLAHENKGFQEAVRKKKVLIIYLVNIYLILIN